MANPMDILVDLLSSKAFVILVIAIVVFLILREFNCWYWKINDRQSLHYQEIAALQEIIELQKDENALLRTMIEKMEQGISGNVSETLEEAAPAKEDSPE